MSPSDLGELLKPFVFLDLAVFEPGERTAMEYLWHPHSGIATVTVMLDGGVSIAETTGKRGLLPKGSIEFMQAGNGVPQGDHMPGGRSTKGQQPHGVLGARRAGRSASS